jgi:hypothetical protein
LNGQVFSLFQNGGGGQFSYASDRAGLRMATIAFSAFGVAFLDYDRDGWPDVVTGNGHVVPGIEHDIPGVTYEEPGCLFHNLGNGRFQDASATAGAIQQPRSVRGLAVGDYDNDGRIDVLCVNRNRRASLFRNTNPDKNHWFSLRLVGVTSNRDGSGAKVWVRVKNSAQYAESRLGASYASSSDKRLFFGLGAEPRADEIRIKWPNGQNQIFAHVQCDKSYTATEDGGIDSEHLHREPLAESAR